jgi:hypothetical protein
LRQHVPRSVGRCHLALTILLLLLNSGLSLQRFLLLQLHLLFLRCLLLELPQILNVVGHPAESSHDIFLYIP